MYNFDSLNFDFDILKWESGFLSEKIKDQLVDQLKIEDEELNRSEWVKSKGEISLKEINKRYLIDTDVHYRVNQGLSSKLVNYSNGIFTLEVILSDKWLKDFNTTAKELGYLWKSKNPELENARGCKVYIIDAKSYPYKQSLIHQGIKPHYDAKKWLIFAKGHLN